VRKWLRLTALLAACGRSPSSPSGNLPFVSESATMRYFHETGDTVEIERQEAFNTWALSRLGVSPPQKVNTANIFREMRWDATPAMATPTRIHTIWPWDNHEVVHVYSAMIGRPSDFFNEGIAVSFQTDPARGDFTVRFNGQQVHDACREYLRSGGYNPRADEPRSRLVCRGLRDPGAARCGRNGRGLSRA
jgi:hypothetical protein